MFFAIEPVHFTGIGGIGMSGLARILHAMGCRVTGSDARASAATAQLERLGIEVHIGHEAGNLPADAAALVATSAAHADNPEIAEARRRGLAVVRRGELLAELMRWRRGAAVAGSHGKTTTCSMLAAIAIEAGLDPTVVVGAFLPALDGANARLGTGEWMVAETDESDGSFLELQPEVAVITNIDREHLEHYGTFEAAREAFLRFANRTSYYGAVVACIDDEWSRALAESARRRVVRYGAGEEADARITASTSGPDGSTFRLSRQGRALGEFRVTALGAHNVTNAAGAVAAALEMGVDVEAARRALERFHGPSRRMEWKGAERGVTVIDDYGHHPTEIRATLAALRLLAPKRLVVLFQPHRYTRARALMDEFATAFGAADVVRVTELYAASEDVLEGVSGETLADRVRESGHADARYAGPLETAVEMIRKEVRAGDLVVTLGAGSVTQAGPELLERLRREEPDGEA